MIATDSRADAIQTDPAFARIKDAVVERTGLAYYLDREDSLARSILGRMHALGLDGFADYYDRLSRPSGATEWAALIDEIAVGETFFFRYDAQFTALTEIVLPDCIARRQTTRRLRIWSAGCASGPEPYSVSILLRRDIAPLIPGWDVSILGTDISTSRLDRARSGRFSDWELRSLRLQDRSPYFVYANGEWVLMPEFRAGVTFETQNLVHDLPDFAQRFASTFDVVLCRNVMIYFDVATIRKLLRGLHSVLADGGWLFVGHSEPHIEMANFFRPYPVADAMLYRKQVESLPLAQGANACSGVISRSRQVSAEPVHRVRARHRGPASEIPAHSRSDHRNRPHPHVRDQGGDIRSVAASTPSDRIPEVRALANVGDWINARKLCCTLIETNQLDADAHYLLAVICEHMDDLSEAETALRQAIYIDGGFALAHYHLACRAAANGEFGKATRFLRNVLAILDRCDDEEAVRAGDGLKVRELRAFARMRFRTLEEGA